MQLKKPITFEYEDSETARATTGADPETAKRVDLHDQKGEDMQSKEGTDGPGMESYFISFEIREE